MAAINCRVLTEKLIINGGKTLIDENTITENRGIKETEVAAEGGRPDGDLLAVGCLGDDLLVVNLSDSLTVTNNIFDHWGSYEAHSLCINTAIPDLEHIIIKDNNVHNATGKRYGGAIEDLTGNNGNISANPLFVDPENDNYNLDPASPAIGMGWNPAPGNTVQSTQVFEVPGDFNSIAAAMATAGYGDVIKLSTEYTSENETLPINVKSGVIITSQAFEDTLNLNLVPETIVEGNPGSTVFMLEHTDNRTIISGLSITNANRAIHIKNGEGFIYGNIFDNNTTGIYLEYDELIRDGFNDNIFIDHNTFSGGFIEMNYDEDAKKATVNGQQKMQFGPVISYNIGSVSYNLDSFEHDEPIFTVFENNNFWPGGLEGYYEGIFDEFYNNFVADPLFFDEENNDFHLTEGSPCLLQNNFSSLIGAQYQYVEVDFEAAPVIGTHPLEVQFTANVTLSLPAEPIYYLWDFGTGDYSDLMNPSYVYNNLGSYTVSLTVRDRYASKTEEKLNFIVVDIPQYLLTLQASPEEGGSVEGGGSYAYEEVAELSASANEGYDFVNWTDDDEVFVSDQAVFEYIMPANDVTLIAHFLQKTYHITAEPNNSDWGLVTGAGYYTHGAEVTLNALPAAGYQFVEWTHNGSQVSKDPQISFTATEDLLLVAYFAPDHIVTDLVLFNMIIDDGLHHCFNATISIITGGEESFVIDNNSSVILVAGEMIHLLPSTHILPGSYLHAYISNEFCDSQPVADVRDQENIAADVQTYSVGSAGEILFTVYPNPTTGKFTLAVKNMADEKFLVIEIFGMLGETVFRKHYQTGPVYELDIDQQIPGLYFIRLSTDKRMGTARIIKR